MSELSLLVAGSFSKLREKAKRMEDNDTSKVETEPEDMQGGKFIVTFLRGSFLAP